MDTDFGSDQPESLSYSPTLDVNCSTCEIIKKKKSRTEYRAGQGLRSKGLKDQSDQNQVLTCENGRGAEGIPVTAEPVEEPDPLAAAPAQIEDAAVAERAPKDGAVEEDVGRVAVGLLLPGLGDEMLVHPEGVEHLGIETDVTCLFEALQLFFTADRGFTLSKHRHEDDLRQIDFVKRDRTLVLFHDLPTFADEGVGIESGITVEVHDRTLVFPRVLLPVELLQCIKPFLAVVTLEVRQELRIRTVNITGRQWSILHGPFLSDTLEGSNSCLFTIASKFP